jgi:thiamine biosynthesis lipoprotein ApbE
MRILPLLAALAAVTVLSACDEKASCTPEEAQKKATDLAAKITEVGAADPTRVADLMPKVQELAAKASSTGEDLAEACKAMDEMMAELSK